MYVKSLTLRGFKSFASATTLRLESGITCIVGPNGSGKSNVVDALAWVMGEQGAKSLRGGKMEDVVFAGTTERPPLGRAEVSMTIDNTDGALPIDYTEVTITRTMFRNGGSDYAINGTSCRLLDIQELLSDSGIGREMHVIVGQGQLDQVLRATPEERRGFIEEAAGVLKHRKRKERALRKLETMEGNLTRLNDLTTEIRRQLGPLGRQAETARRATGIQAALRDARLRLLADDIATLTATLNDELAAETALVQRRTACEQNLAEVAAEVTLAEEASRVAAPALAQAQDTYYQASALVDRFRSTQDLAAERVRLLDIEAVEATSGAAPHRGVDPEQLAEQAAQVRRDEAALDEQVGAAETVLAKADDVRAEAEAAHTAEQSRISRLLQATADRREGLARLAGQVAARRSRIEAAKAELGRLRKSEEAIESRARTAEREFAALEVGIADAEQGEQGLDHTYETAETERVTAAERVQRGQEAQRAAQVRVSTLQARCEALDMSMQRKDGAAALLTHEAMRGIHGTVSSLITVQSGREAQVAAALGWAGEALVIESVEDASAGLGWLREADLGQAGMLIPGLAPEQDEVDRPALPPGSIWAADALDADDADLVRAVRSHVAYVALVETAADAVTLVARQNESALVAVTRAGDIYGGGWVRGGSADGPSLIEVESALEEARSHLGRANADAERAAFEMQRDMAALQEAEAAADQALEELHRSDAQMAAVAEQLGQLGSSMRSARGERERTRSAIEESQTALAAAHADVEHLEERLAAAEAEQRRHEAPSDGTAGPAVADTDARPALAEAAARARSGETEARLSLRTCQERARAFAGRADALEAAAADEITARAQAAARTQRRAQESAVATAVASASAYLVQCAQELVQTASEQRDSLATRQSELEQQLRAARERSRLLGEELRELTTSVHQDEIARAEQRLRIETLHARSLEEHGVDPTVLLAEFGPDQPVPVLDPTTGVDASADPWASDEAGVVLAAQPARFERSEQEKRLRSAERKLSSLGRVNPLALEEFAALEERHTYLSGQVDDLRRSSTDLLNIVKEVDDRIERVFAEAFEDTAAQFEIVFERLFPGGEGRLVLTDPDNMLTTGIEVEARPPGKRIKRLSLLSGGERSLTAVALLVAIFKARPSPFYIMDEVEAALDDTNLGRLITLFEELRDSSQLIVITHQKRTMEVADALYGMSMQGDGVTTVISQRLRRGDRQPA